MKTPVRISTPLSSSATRIELPGAGEPGMEVIIALRRPGAQTHAVDRFETARMRASDATALISPGMS
jgi:phosphoribosylglycinamide formyltransferase 2